MENRRILNRIIFINIANTDYASIEIAGNTCFVGTNNMGKTTLQRAILFFYSANTRGLGVDEATAVLVERDATAKIVGAGSAFIVSLRGHVGRCARGPRWQAAVA